MKQIQLPDIRTIDAMVEDIQKLTDLKPPFVNIQNISRALGGTVLVTNTNAIRKVGNEFIIEIKEGGNKDQKFFEMLGYLFIVMGYRIDKDLWKKTKYSDLLFIKNHVYLEYFANSFRMPKQEFLRIWEFYRNDITVDTNAVADHFQVSFDLVIKRAKSLGLYQN